MSAAPTGTPIEDPRSAAPASPIDEYELCLFRPSNFVFNVRDLELPEDFFNATLAEVQGLSGALSSRVRNLNDAPLKTKKMREAEEEAKMAKFRKVLIRVLLPDRYALQGVFRPKSTIADVYKFVRTCLKSDDIKFHLFVTPPRVKLDQMKNTLWKEGFAPAAQVRLQVEAGPSESQVLLKEYVFSLAQEAPPPKSQPQVDVQQNPAAKSGISKTAPAKGKSKVPKWFKKK